MNAMKVFATVVFAAVMTGCDGHPIDRAMAKLTGDSPSCNCDPDALSRLVLDKLDGQGIVNYNSANLPPNKEAVIQQFAILDRIDKWADTLKDRCVRDEYHQWMWVYRREDHEALEEIATHARQKDYEAYEARETAIEQKMKECDGCVVSPPKADPTNH